MARVSQSDQYRVSLFPMFNILICTLGVLIFILGALTTLALGVGKSVSIEVAEGLDGTSVDHTKTPHYLEWDGASLVAHPGRETVHFAEDVSGIENFKETYNYIDKEIDGSDLGSLIKRIKGSHGEDYVVLLVRPSGFHSLYEVRGYIESQGISIGYEPIKQGWKIRIRE